MSLHLFKVKHPLTLDPLLESGQAALAPDPSNRIVCISLRMLFVLWGNAFNEKTIRTADDLFACAANNGRYYDPIPKGGALAEAGLDILYEESPEPHSIEIVPPHTLRLQDLADAPRILLFLADRGFQRLQKVVLALILASAAFSVGGCLSDDIDDDSDSEPAVHLLVH
jgi:hypothetical protein